MGIMKKALNIIFLTGLMTVNIFLTGCMEDSYGLDSNYIADTLSTSDISTTKDTAITQSLLSTDVIIADIYDREFDLKGATQPALYKWLRDTLPSVKNIAELDTSVSPPLLSLNFDSQNVINEYYTSRDQWIESLTLNLNSRKVYGLELLNGGLSTGRWSAVTVRIKYPRDRIIYSGTDSWAEIQFNEYEKNENYIKIVASVTGEVPQTFDNDKILSLECRLQIIFDLQ